MGTYKTGNGTVIELGAELGGGGEGKIYAIQSDSSLAAKIYLPGIASWRKEKVVAMIAAKLHSATPFVAYPIDVILDSKGVFFRIYNAKNAGPKTGSSALWAQWSQDSFPESHLPYARSCDNQYCARDG
jgi:hypothetical protein